jgi:hypothetical protein
MRAESRDPPRGVGRQGATATPPRALLCEAGFELGNPGAQLAFSPSLEET